jgi:hypothetical protein
MKGLRIALAVLFVAACGGDSAITGLDELAAPPVRGGILALGVDSTTGASIETNKDDYSPGEVVHLVGRGWAAGETVNLHMIETPDTHGDIDTNVVADANGGFELHFYDVQMHDLNVTFTLTATGQTSHSVAVATFTDGNVSLASTSPVAGVMSSAISFGSPTCTATVFTVGTSVSFSNSGSHEYPECAEVRAPTSVVVSGVTYTFSSWTVSSLQAGSTSISHTTGTVGSSQWLKFVAPGQNTTGAITANYAAAPSNTAPTLGGVPATEQFIPEQSLYSFTATGSDGDLPAQALTLSIIGSLPSGASFNPSTGVFEWTPTEEQGPSGPHTFTVRVSDGDANTDHSVTINVLEVNQAPVLSVPASFSTQWGVSLPNGAATASDADLPANTLTFSKVSGPSWVTVAGDGTMSYGSIPSSAIGAHTVTIKVEDDGDPVMNDEESFTITVTARPTKLEYTGKNAGQYSDESTLSAELKDDGDGPLNGAAIAGAAVDLWFNGAVVCDDKVTDASGVATCDYPVAIGAGTVKVKATFDAASGYAGSTSAEEDFVVSKENAEFVSVAVNGGNGSMSVAQVSFDVTLGLKEKLASGNEPEQNDGQLAGNINLGTVSAKMVGLATNTSYNGTCTAGSAVASNSYVTREWSCSFGSGPFAVDAYTLSVDIPSANNYLVANTYEEGLAIWDPYAGFATGGGTFMLDGDRVSFGFSYTLTKGKSTPRSGFVVIRHMADGGVCRVKSNNQMNPAAVNGNTVVLTGKGNYSCVDANGQAIAGQSAGNISIAAYAEDNATPGAGADKFWVSNGAAVTPNYLQMDETGGAAANAITLRGGNVQVPQPGKKQ